jgi:hypothetical protein
MSKLAQTLTVATKLPEGLEEQLKGSHRRREKKIMDSAAGIIIGLIGIALMTLAGYLFVQSIPAIVAGTITIKSAQILISAVLGGIGFFVVVMGATMADRETVWPVVKSFFNLYILFRKGESKS